MAAEGNTLDWISSLPLEISLMILEHMDPAVIGKLSQTSRNMRSTTEDDKLWKDKCDEAGFPDILSSREKEILEGRSLENDYFNFSPWKANFIKHRRELRIEMNLTQNPIYRKPRMLRGSNGFSCQCLKLFEDKIICGSGDKVKIWSVSSGKLLFNMTGHKSNVRTIQINKEFVVSGSEDKNLKVWSSETGKYLNTLRGHTDIISCSDMHGDIAVSGSRDNTVRLWNVRAGTSLKTLEGHQSPVRCVQYNGKLVASGGEDNRVNIWDSDTSECLHTLLGHEGAVVQVKLAGGLVVSGSLDRKVKVWDVVTGTCQQNMTFSSFIEDPVQEDSIALQGNVLISANSYVRIRNILTGSCITGSFSPYNIASIQLDNKFVVIASRDGRIQLYDVKTGLFIRNLLEMGSTGNKVMDMKMKEGKIVMWIFNKYRAKTDIMVLDFDH